MTDPRKFDEYRKKLIRLTEEADRCVTELAEDADFKNYVGKAPSEIRYSLSILNQNVFPIALFAKTQAGKSTTTAAMADGREITPCGRGGGGLRTSTVSVTIYNDDNVQEVEINGVRTTPVEINLYTNQELVQCILDAASGHLDDSDPNSYDLDNATDRAKLKAAVESEIEIYKDSTNTYPSSKLATLREAILILAFYGSDAHQNLLAGKLSTIAGMQSFLKTDGWETKWENLAQDGFDKTAKKFTAEGSLHVFVNSIRVPVKSAFMKDTGTAITDAPGTMANLRDTIRAINAASESAVIVFVVDSELQFNEEDRNQLKTLYESGLADKVVFVMNFKRKPGSPAVNDVEKQDLSVLSQEGFKAQHHQKFLYCNSYLAVHAAQGEMIANGTFDPLSEKGLLEDAKQMDVPYGSAEEAWKNTTQSVLGKLNNFQLMAQVANATLTPGNEIFKQIREVSRWDEMISSLRAHILQNRAGGVLLDLGARPVVKTLESIERTLRQREEAAEIDLKTLQAQYEQAQQILEDFSKQADIELAQNFTNDIDKALARDYYDKVLLNSINETAQIAAPQIFDSTNLMDNIKALIGTILAKKIPFVDLFIDVADVTTTDTIKRRCSNIISATYKIVVSKKIAAWAETLENSNAYVTNVQKNVLNTRKNLQQIWQDLSQEENGLLIDIDPIPMDITGSMKSDVNAFEFQFSGDTTIQAQFDFMNIIKSLLAAGGTYVGGAWIYLYVLPATLVIPFIGPILLGLSILVALLVKDAGNNDRQKQIDAISQDIVKDMRNKLMDDRDSIEDKIILGSVSEEDILNPDSFYNALSPVEKGKLSAGIKFVRLFYLMFFKATIEQQKAKLEAKYNQALAELELSQEKRDLIKAKAEKIRTEQITPLRKKVAAVEQEITKVFG